ncbi:Sir2 family NAD-dependent protein deacetylase [Paenarthrobacter sp. YJN-5]|uniref:SIR2 family NAD-dependent protein deacylase n=1 Tax=Paenarthrobacter sp. YJN-5 TaxID=2735316 RepID=UPI001877B7B2|nr:Sir2 family NAD-dependent protein deacetylase [Paenarthrobacter sp. YJN-5]QOT19488.1 NAD-dependent protein deacetylase [Paenarthrobacter sp. YJN-5]
METLPRAARPAPTLDDVRERLQRPDARVLVLTGAGVSVAAGLPTYRGNGGLYKDGGVIPLTASDATSRSIHKVWQHVGGLRAGGPTPLHRALAALGDTARTVTVATQNIDGLHAFAGSTELALHGTIARARCLNPKYEHATEVRLETMPQSPEDVPRCQECNARLRPDVVLFGERLSMAVWSRAWRASEEADVVLAVGTSLQVHPAADLVLEPVSRGIPGAWLDLDPARMLPDVDVTVRDAASRLVQVPGDCQVTLPALLGL